MHKKKKEKILIFANQGLGDCIMMLPVLKKFIQNENEYIILCKGKYESSVFHLLNYENIKFEFRHKKVGSIFDAFKLILFSLKQRLTGIDKVYAPMLPGNIFYFFILKIINSKNTYVTNEKYLNSFKVIMPAYWDYKGHYVKYFNDFFKVNENHSIPVYKSIDKKINFSKKNEKLIAIGPGSGITELNKIPSLEWYISLVKELKSYIEDIRFLFYGGGKYDEFLINILQSLYPESSNILYNTSIEELITKLSECKLIISGTTGPGHLASLTSKPLIILANSTNVFESAPYSDKITFITNYNDFKCAPCYRRNFNNGCGELKCLNTLSHKKVVTRVKELLENISELRNDYNSDIVIKTKNKTHLEI